jgi:hypothetical protein
MRQARQDGKGEKIVKVEEEKRRTNVRRTS